MINMAAQFALALVAGALLNLTPCVLPVMPVKIRTILQHAGESARGRSQAAIAFLAGTLLFFLILGLVSAVLHWTWGALFQSRFVLAVLVAVLAGAGIMVFADVSLPVPHFAYRSGGGRHFEPFSSGALTAVLATPCTGPFLGGVLAFALTQPPIVVVGIFVSIGLGLAAPYVIILLKPGLLDRLPKSGEWSQRLRQALAFLLFAGAAFFAQSLLSASLGLWPWLIWAGLLLAWAAITTLRARSFAPRAVAIAFAAIFLAGAYAGGFIGHRASGPLDWQMFSPSRLAAAQALGRPALVEFTAEWCINCKILERTVYVAPEVAKAARNADLVVLRADLTTPHPALERLLVHYGGAGLPFAVVVSRSGVVIQRFSGLFTAGALAEAIDQTQKPHAKSGKT